ncbi:DUF1285 domain-containing protein [Novosphingobium sp. 1949]|uniref:DUF1285 domain-containing protein n=1 Tax=Novosphingobium organovorum TaxID=2930092 RepID=A0ABT0B826_9SPHN|nr:DUF1285 domain-containing protein [Novosphingobium organovorum]MCJ2181221.1 DUF1285 domain-containing protein [Novosphingobium organovorum]
MPYDVPPDLAGLSLADAAALLAARKLPPVETWTPAHCGDSAMRILADGRWLHEGRALTRPAMVRAFSSLLVRDAKGTHWLVTPGQKLSIAVEDAAFLAVDVTRQDGALLFRLNTDELVVAGPDHPILSRGDPDTPALYLGVRHGCEARLNRSTYAQLVALALDELGDQDDPENLAVTSGATRFSLLPA